MKRIIICCLLVLSCSFGAGGCGDKPIVIPPVQAIVATTDAQLRAAQMKAYVTLEAAGNALNEASKLEQTLSASLPAGVHASAQREFARVARLGLTLIDDLEAGRVKLSEFQARFQPVVDGVGALQALTQQTGHPKLQALLQFAGELVGQLLTQRR